MNHAHIEKKATPSLLILVAISMVAPSGINIIAPSMSAFVDVFATDYGTVQLTLSIFLLAVAFSQLVIGPLSDFFGRRPVVLIGMTLSVCGCLVCVFAPSIDVFIAGRALQGMGACTGVALARTIVRDLYNRSRAAAMIGYVTMAMSVAPMVVPMIGGILQEYVAWWASSVFMLVFTGVVLAGALVNLHETNPYLGQKPKISKLLDNYRILLGNLRFLSFISAAAFGSAVYFTFMGGAPLISSHLLHMSPTGYGLYFIFVAVGYGFGNFLTSQLSERYGIIRLMVGGSFLNFAGVMMLVILFSLNITHPLSLFAPVFFTSVANGITLPTSISGAISVHPHLAGTASGLTGFAQIGLGAIATTLVGKWLNVSLSFWPLIITMTIASTLAVICSLSAKHFDGLVASDEIAPASNP